MRHEQKKKFNMSLYITLPMCSKCKHLLMKWTNINKQIHAQSFGTCYFRVQTSFLSKKKKDRKDYPLNMFTVANKTDTSFFLENTGVLCFFVLRRKNQILTFPTNLSK